MPAERMRRVNEAVREVVSSSIGSLVDADAIGILTVTGVETSPDLRRATVFVSVLGGERQREQTLSALAEARSELQHEIAAHLRIKYTPRLRFVYDESVERAMRIAGAISEQQTTEPTGEALAGPEETDE